ncbi:MAG TPA: ABC transporter permease [Pedococcus sp.]|nr:ABC transporter permease [Pedococcus sp.]
MSAGRLTVASSRELGTVALVAGLCGTYAAVLVTGASTLSALGGGHAAVGAILTVVADVLVLIALYVGAVVIVNAVDTVVCGRLRHLALLRLLGAGSRSLRAALVRATAVVGAAGALLGIVAGTALAHLGRMVLVDRGDLPDRSYPLVSAQLPVALAAIVAAAVGAGWVGSRAVLRASPVAALGGAETRQPPRLHSSRRRLVTAAVFVVGGGAVLVLGALIGEASPLGFLLAFLGAAGSSTGLLVGARFVMPRVVAGLGRVLGSDTASVIARRNAVLDPMRTTRSTMGLVIGVALVTTFASGTSALRASVAQWETDPAQRTGAAQLLGTTSTVLVCLIVVSSVIAAVGFVSTMSLTVTQRHREIGLLRTLGLTRRQVRTMVTKEAVALSVAAVVLGVALGLVYGTLGAQSLVGVRTHGLVWGVPVPALAVIGLSALLLVLVASLRPARRAVEVAPVEAMRLDA